jgi:hypothetical protein
MEKISYLRGALTTPALLTLAAWATERAGFPTMLADVLVGSMAIGGVPYFLTLTVLLAISVRGSMETFEKWWFFSPILMVLMCGVCGFAMMVFVGFSKGWEPVHILVFLGLWMMTGMYSLILGYIYVLIAAWGLVILQRFSLITGAPNALRLSTGDERSAS